MARVVGLTFEAQVPEEEPIMDPEEVIEEEPEEEPKPKKAKKK